MDSGILFRQTSDKKKMVRFFLFSGMQAKYGYLYRREIPIFWNKFVLECARLAEVLKPKPFISVQKKALNARAPHYLFFDPRT